MTIRAGELLSNVAASNGVYPSLSVEVSPLSGEGITVLRFELTEKLWPTVSGNTSVLLHCPLDQMEFKS